MKAYSTCPVCGSTDLTEVLTARDHTVSGELFKICHCRNCSFRFTNPVPDENEIGKYYKSEEYISHSNTSKGLINNLYQRVRNYTLKSKRRMVVKGSGMQSGTLLDIGCGTGDFLGEMKRKGWTVKGLEPDEGAREQARKNHGLDVGQAEDLFALEADSYDVITMWHVLEHIHRLDDYIDSIARILKPNGLLIIAVPNYNSYDAEKYEEWWAAYDVPRHLYHFTEKSMRKLFMRFPLQVKQIKMMPFDSFYVSMLSEKYKEGSTIRGIWNGFWSYLGAIRRTDRCSSLIYQVRHRDVG